jgi:hypothetical protein
MTAERLKRQSVGGHGPHRYRAEWLNRRFNNKSGTAIKHYAFVSFLRRGLFIILEEE